MVNTRLTLKQPVKLDLPGGEWVTEVVGTMTQSGDFGMVVLAEGTERQFFFPMWMIVAAEIQVHDE